MGIINQGILGGFSGKVGPIVGFHWKSKYYIRARAAKVSNPRTPKQQEQRGKFATAFSFLKAIKPFIRIGYKEFTQEKPAFNAAMSYTLKRAVTGNGKETSIDFNRALVSIGTLMPAFEGTATQNEDQMYFNWQDNSGMGNAEDTDIAMYNSIRLTVTVPETTFDEPDIKNSPLWTSSDRISFYPELKQPVINNISIKSLTHHSFTGKPFQGRLYGTG